MQQIGGGSPLTTMGLTVGASQKDGAGTAPVYALRVAGADLGYIQAQDVAFVRLERSHWPWETQDGTGRLRLGLAGQAVLAVGSATDVCEGRRDAADTSRLVLEQNLAGQLEVRGDEYTRFRVGVSYPLFQTEGRYLRHSRQFDVQRLQQCNGLGGSAEMEFAHPDKAENLRCAIGVRLQRTQVQQRHILGWGRADALQSEVYLRAAAGTLACVVGYEPVGNELRCSVGVGL